MTLFCPQHIQTILNQYMNEKCPKVHNPLEQFSQKILQPAIRQVFTNTSTIQTDIPIQGILFTVKKQGNDYYIVNVLFIGRLLKVYGACDDFIYRVYNGYPNKSQFLKNNKLSAERLLKKIETIFLQKGLGYVKKVHFPPERFEPRALYKILGLEVLPEDYRIESEFIGNGTFDELEQRLLLI